MFLYNAFCTTKFFTLKIPTLFCFVFFFFFLFFFYMVLQLFFLFTNTFLFLVRNGQMSNVVPMQVLIQLIMAGKTNKNVLHCWLLNTTRKKKVTITNKNQSLPFMWYMEASVQPLLKRRMRRDKQETNTKTKEHPGTLHIAILM